MSRTMSSSAGAVDQPPPAIPDVDLLRRIGRGGFGEVWLGRNRATGALKAVKIIPLAGNAADPAGREIVSLTQFEAQRIARHPHLLDIQHVGRTDEVLFYLMEPADDVSGRAATDDPSYRPATLSLRLEQGPLPADDCLRVARQLASGLAHLHAAGLAIYEMLTGLPAEAFPRLGERAREIAADPVLTKLNRVALRAASRDHHARYAHAGELVAAVDAVSSSPGQHRKTGAWWAAGAAAIAAAVTLAGLVPTARPVTVNFVTSTFEAEVLVDGELLRDRDGKPLTSPCTATGVPSGVHRVSFRHPLRGTFDAGPIDFRSVREVVADW